MRWKTSNPVSFPNPIHVGERIFIDSIYLGTVCVVNHAPELSHSQLEVSYLRETPNATLKEKDLEAFISKHPSIHKNH